MSERRPSTVREIIHALTVEYVDLDQPVELPIPGPPGSRFYLSADVHCRTTGQSIDYEEFRDDE